MKQTLFAFIIGVHPMTVSKWECGKLVPNGSQLIILKILEGNLKEGLKLLWKIQADLIKEKSNECIKS